MRKVENEFKMKIEEKIDINISKEIDKELDSFIPKINCKLCGKQEERGKNNNKKYCINCKKEARKLGQLKYNTQEKKKSLFLKGNKHIIKIKCENCNRIRYDYKIKHRRFCGRKCLNEWKSKNFKPKNKQNIKINCKNCDIKITTNNSKIRTGQKFCSRKCFEEDRKKNWSFPHKGKPLEEWLFQGVGQHFKLKKYRENLREKMKDFHKKNQDFFKNRKGKTLVQIYGEEKAKEIKQKIRENNLILWQIPEYRQKWLKTNGRFKKGMSAWNKGIPANKIAIKNASITRERNYLKKIGIIK